MTQTTLRDYLRNTEDAISAGRYDDAMASCQTILTYFPEALEAQRLLGEVYLAQGHLEEAQQTFDWILTNDPENVVVYCNRALISERVSDIDTALDCYQQAYELSRGSSHIRQEFNQLSARVGQQEFMFSRAGLARLYMRGDLLTQAVQEWEAVLSNSPDRLDARLGLMETYWREGIYDKVDQMANEIIEELPTCLKALLLLAHVTSISNIQRARELIERAKTLDPELVMAEALFDDLAASQPNDPFLALLKKEPIFFSNGQLIVVAKADNQGTTAVVEPANGHAQSPSPAPDPWGTLDNWSELDTRMANYQLPDVSPPATAEPLSNGIHTIEDWTSTQAQAKDSSALESEPWQSLQEGDVAFDASVFEKQPWYQAEQFAAGTHLETAPSWDTPSSKDLIADVEAWSGEAHHEERPTPPAWLDSLTHNEQQPPAGTISVQPVQPDQAPGPAVLPEQPEKPSAPEVEEASPGPLPGKSWSEESSTPTALFTEEDAAPVFLASDDSDNDMGWPEWLKSLGAATLEPEPEPESTDTSSPMWSEPLAQTSQQPPEVPQASAPQPQSAPEPEQSSTNTWDALDTSASTRWDTSRTDSWTSESDPWIHSQHAWSQESTQPPVADWLQQLSSAWPQLSQAQPEPPAEQIQPAQSEPAPSNSQKDQQELETVGREQSYIASLEDLEKSLHTQGFVPMEPGTLSSIAQNQAWQSPLELEHRSQSTQSVEPAQPFQPIQVAPEEHTLSSALAHFGNLKQPAETEPKQPVAQQRTIASALPPEKVAFSESQPSEPSFVPSSQMPQAPQPVHVSEPASPIANTAPMQETPLVSAYRSDPLLDSELETTMKRPAIHLQPLQHGVGDKPGTGGRGRLTDRKGQKEADGNLSNHDRLLRGYQYQLAGSYDDAMQEYRVIIRNAPELLDDVISNVRALLKLAPRFSLGYRVLGDAYMRKGEYLQAMEAYNKALTMAKKARS